MKRILKPYSYSGAGATGFIKRYPRSRVAATFRVSLRQHYGMPITYFLLGACGIRLVLRKLFS